MTKKPRENRVPIMMSDEELQAIDDWRFENRIGTRSDAVRRLVQTALVFDAQSSELAKYVQELEAFAESAGQRVEGISKITDEQKLIERILDQLMTQHAALILGNDKLLMVLVGVLGNAALLKGQGDSAEKIRDAQTRASKYFDTLNGYFKRNEGELKRRLALIRGDEK